MRSDAAHARGLSTAENLVRTYFRAKDGNRPHLMAQVFSEQADLEMCVKTGAISFPPVAQGLASITDVLVRQFGQTYENVYSFCLRRPPSDTPVERFSCDWLVGMSDKANGNVRVGCGRYDWTFQSKSPFLVARLKITIETMQVLPPDNLEAVLGWLTALPYPWCSGDVVAKNAPRVRGLEPIIEYVAGR